MAFDEKLAERIRTHLGKRRGLVEKKMFNPTARCQSRTPGCSI